MDSSSSLSNINDTHTQHTRRHTHKPSAAELSVHLPVLKVQRNFLSRLGVSPLHLASNNLAPPTSWLELSARQTGFPLTGLYVSFLLRDHTQKERRNEGFQDYFAEIIFLVPLWGLAHNGLLFLKSVENVFFKPYFLIDFAV